jgi:hypothetical protein
MLDRSQAPRALRLLALLAWAGLAVASCSSSGTTNNRGDGSPLTLVSTCDQICNNVVAQCVPAAGLYNTCTSACGDLALLPSSCLDPFLSYVTCVAGATSVRCGADGTYVLITPSQCEEARQETLDCNASPGLVAACVALPGNGSCASPDLAGTTPEFCVGAPNGCMSPVANPLGIGVYCCP